jgi:RNA polymerase sigma factor (sigma-70 family)
VSVDLGLCSDSELAALALGGKQQAFGEFLKRYREPTFRLVRNIIRDESEALDLTQETFVSAFAALHRYDSERPFRFWISRIAINKCRDWERRRAVRRFFFRALPLDAAFDAHSDEPSPEATTSDRLELERVNQAIGCLPPKLREAIVLRAVEEMTQAEAATALGVSEKTVETRLYRARKALATLLEENSEG